MFTRCEFPTALVSFVVKARSILDCLATTTPDTSVTGTNNGHKGLGKTQKGSHDLGLEVYNQDY